MKHYEGDLGIFDYDENVWTLFSNSLYTYLRPLRKELKDCVLELPKGCTNCILMFEGCTLNNVQLVGFDRGDITDMSWMFRNCSIVNMTVANLNLRSVKSVVSMFYGARIDRNAQVDMRTWDFSNVVKFTNMLNGVDLGRFLGLGNIDFKYCRDVEPELFGLSKKSSCKQLCELVGFDRDQYHPSAVATFEQLWRDLEGEYKRLGRLGVDKSCKNSFVFASVLVKKLDTYPFRGGVWDDDKLGYCVKYGHKYRAYVLRNVPNVFVSLGNAKAKRVPDNLVIYPVEESNDRMIVVVKGTDTRFFKDQNRWAEFSCFYVPKVQALCEDGNEGMQWLGADAYPTDVSFKENVVLYEMDAYWSDENIDSTVVDMNEKQIPITEFLEPKGEEEEASSTDFFS